MVHSYSIFQFFKYFSVSHLMFTASSSHWNGYYYSEFIDGETKADRVFETSQKIRWLEGHTPGRTA